MIAAVSEPVGLPKWRNILTSKSPPQNISLPHCIMTKIILAEDHALVREGLKLLLETLPGMHVVAETGNGAAVEALVRDLLPDLLLLDLDLPGCHGNEVATRIKAQFSSVKILVLTGSLSAESVGLALAAGVDGYILKHENTGDLLGAIRAVLAGRQYVSKSIAALFQENGADHHGAMPVLATPREQEIMCMIARGVSNQDIATILHISVFTVRTHRQNLMEKLSLRNAAEVTAYAVKHGFYTPA